MKNLLKTALLSAALIASIATATTASAAEKPKKEIVKCSYTTDIDCQGCVTKVMNTLPYQKGVKSVNVDLPKKTITVEYDKAKCSNEAVIAHLKKVDIKATACDPKVTATECHQHSAGCCK